MRMTVPEVKAPKICLAKNQAEYRVLTVALVNHPQYGVPFEGGHNSLLMAFRPSIEERAAIASGADIYVSLLHCGQPMQPILTCVGKREAASVFGVEVEA
jgi:hypothetical protein